MAGGIDQYTKLLLHCDGPDASTTFTDSGVTGHSVTANGNVQIDTAQSKFGGAAALFDGTGDYLTVPVATDFDFGSGDFTVDFWARRNGAQTGFCGLFITDTSGSGGWNLLLGSSGVAGTTNAPYFADNSQAVALASSTVLADATWTHVALIRSGDTLYLFQDGTQTASVSVAGKSFDYGAATVLTIGANSTLYYNGWIDELRISKGIARWTANFTPPSAPYSRLTPVVHNYRTRRAA